MIIVKNKRSLDFMAEAGALLAYLFQEILTKIVVPGISTLEIDTRIAHYLKEKSLVSQTKGYCGYRHVSCISINDEIVHGVPSAEKRIQEGDLVKIDVCAAMRGYCADMARCFMVGEMPETVKKLVTVAYSSLDKGIKQVQAGNHITDISAAIQAEIDQYGFGIIRDFAGHGIGRHMHEDPEILNYGKPGKGPIIREGMAFAIEPMLTLGSYERYIAADGWTAKTVDKSIAAHVEDTVIVTQHGPCVITRLL